MCAIWVCCCFFWCARNVIVFLCLVILTKLFVVFQVFCAFFVYIWNCCFWLVVVVVTAAAAVDDDCCSVVYSAFLLLNLLPSFFSCQRVEYGNSSVGGGWYRWRGYNVVGNFLTYSSWVTIRTIRTYIHTWLSLGIHGLLLLLLILWKDQSSLHNSRPILTGMSGWPNVVFRLICVSTCVICTYSMCDAYVCACMLCSPSLNLSYVR